jgi:hypothetical protein
MEGYGDPAQPSPTIAQRLNGGIVWLEVECNRCKTRASLPLDAFRRPRDTADRETRSGAEIPVRCSCCCGIQRRRRSKGAKSAVAPIMERIVFMPNFLEHFQAEPLAEFTYFPIASMSTAPRQPENSPEVTNTLFEPATKAEVPLGTMQAIKPTIRAGFFLPTPALTSSVPCCNE